MQPVDAPVEGPTTCTPTIRSPTRVRGRCQTIQPAREPAQRRWPRSARGCGMRWCWLVLLCGACVAHARPPADAFHAMVDREWAWRLQESPLLASRVGVREADDRLDRVDAAT